jgi:hypothetical protein
MKTSDNLRLRALEQLLRDLDTNDDDLVERCRIPQGSQKLPPVLNKIESAFGSIYENFFPNQLYGISAIIRAYYDLGWAPLPVVFGHGVHDTSPVWSLETKVPFPIACYSDYSKLSHIAAAINLKIDKRFIYHTHPYELLCRMKSTRRREIRTNSSLPNTRSQKKCIVFPDHSTNRVKVYQLKTDNKRRLLEGLRGQFSEVNLCIYYIDLVDAIQGGYWPDIADGYDRVFCMGERYNPSFLVNLHAVLTDHTAVVLPFLGSVAYFSKIQGKKIIFWNKSENLNVSMEKAVGMSAEEHRERQIIDIINAFERSWIPSSTGFHDISESSALERMINAKSDGEWFKDYLKTLFNGEDVFIDPKIYSTIHKILVSDLLDDSNQIKIKEFTRPAETS